MEERIRQQVEEWKEHLIDQALIEELDTLLAQDDESDLIDAFYRTLSFGTAGLRGIMGVGTNRMNIYTVGQATQGLADYLNQSTQDHRPSVAISFDSRLNSALFSQTAASVLAANGIEVHIYPRLEPTPALSFAVRHLGCDAGINITASHNPAEYNGYKVYGSDGCQITEKAAEAISECISLVNLFDGVNAVDFNTALEDGRISLIPEETITAFINAVHAQSVEPDDEDGEVRVVYTPLNGTGLECVTKIFDKIGVTDVHLVESQKDPDGHFPTCPRPNPEIRQALEEGIKVCEQVHPDLLLATDPDADRVGIAVKNDADYVLLTGNEVGSLLLDYLCRERIAHGIMPQEPIAVTTIVSSDMVEPIAEKYGVTVKRVLTGFKYIGEQIGILEKYCQEDRFIFGFEESYGYLAGSHVRDKDAIVASMLIVQMARYYRKSGMNLVQAMQKLYEEFGFYVNRTMNFQFDGFEGQQQMKSIMEGLRASAPASIGGYPVTQVLDYLNGVGDLPSSNVLEFRIEGDYKVVIRPSGTEPKIKVYVFSHGVTRDESQAVLEELADAAKGLVQE
ncbi:MAG: phospho-sugar mutase [Eggerthellaceae bacterium]|jgi:phosphoglucomutase